MELAELMTIAVLYKSFQSKNFKHFYFYLLKHHKKDFPQILSYSRFAEVDAASHSSYSFFTLQNGKIYGH
jgi:hypothetical protein